MIGSGNFNRLKVKKYENIMLIIITLSVTYNSKMVTSIISAIVKAFEDNTRKCAYKS
jgi:hypothetical protein